MSLTYQGIIVMAVGYVFNLTGVPFAQGNLETTITTIIAFVGAVAALIGRYRLGGLTIFGTRL